MSEVPAGAGLYEEFVERYFQEGDSTVLEEWPAEVRERCLFFLKVVESPSISRSRVAVTGAGSGEASTQTGRDAAAPPPDELCARVDRYVIEREIARGGMGQVLLAYDRD